MLSRVAQQLYWIGRYVERAENTARLITVTQHLLLDLPRGTCLGWEPLIAITGSADVFHQIFKRVDERNVVRFLIADERNPGSLLRSLSAARENARTIREIIPREAWEKLNGIYLDVRGRLPAALARQRRHAFLSEVIDATQQMTGLLAGTMLHNEGYAFLRIGRNLERADMTSRIIDVRSANLLEVDAEELAPYENIQWMSVLQSLSAYQSYRQRMQAPVRRELVLQFLLQEEQFPRAFYHCVRAAEASVRDLPRHREVARVAAEVGELVSRAPAEELEGVALHRFVDQLQLELGRLHAAIHSTWFAMQALPKARVKAREAETA